MDDHDLVDDLLDLGQDVTRDEDRPPLRRKRAQKLAQPTDSLRVEPVRRLVEHEDAGIAEQRPREAEALAHSERVTACAAPRSILQVDDLEHLLDPRARDSGCRSQNPQMISPGAAGMEVGRLEHGPDLLRRRLELDGRAAP